MPDPIKDSIETELLRSNAQPPVPPRWLAPGALGAALLVVGLLVRLLTAPPETVSRAATVTAEAINSGAGAQIAAANEAAAAWSALGDMMEVKLPDGSDLSVPALGVEARLVSFLSERATPVSHSPWFDLDRLLFDSGKATLQAPSAEQLANIAAILKAYPQLTIRIAAYTDDSGEAAANLRLSEERADSVVDELVKLGVDPARLSARGYGQKHPLADNGTEQGRQKNRRISLRVTERQTSA